MNIAICDDDKKLCSYLSEVLTSYYENKGHKISISVFNSGEEIIESRNGFDIVFMDVEMDGLDGIATSTELKKKNKDLIILIITSYNEYLDDAFSVNAFRFLSKPIDITRLYKALDDADNALLREKVSFYDSQSNEETVLYKSKIIIAEVFGRKTKLITNDKTYVSNKNIGFWREKLSASSFITPHTSYIANMDFVISHKRTTLVLARFDNNNNPTEKFTIPIAPKKQAEVKIKFLSFLESR